MEMPTGRADDSQRTERSRSLVRPMYGAQCARPPVLKEEDFMKNALVIELTERGLKVDSAATNIELNSAANHVGRSFEARFLSWEGKVIVDHQKSVDGFDE